MILCKFEKINTAVYTPHLDLMRGVMMAMRRTGLKIQFSEGFNPHERIYFNNPSPVGTGSVCEYFAADSVGDPKVFMEKLNGSLQPGVRILKAAESAVNPNFANLSYAAEYEIEFTEPVTLPDFKEILAARNFVIMYTQKNETVEKDVRELILNLKGSGKKYYFTLASGNRNLRADRLTNYLLKLAGAENQYYTATKTRVFTKELIDVDSLFFNR